MTTKIKHDYVRLDGEALDTHLVAQHGWHQHMVASRGAVAHRGDDPSKMNAIDYAENYHRTEHSIAQTD